ncbi:MAG: type III pantothenate kinase [Betaproteobacteria bacterium]|nr:MAG: type III pantothenate kinase [Betaproteobacteria bacterium]
MFLAIDIGNTRLKWALYTAREPGAVPQQHGAVFLEMIDQLGETDWSGLAAPGAVLGCCVAGDAVRHRVEDQLDELWGLHPSWVVPGHDEAGVHNGYEHPARLGADRWVAVIGAREHLQRRGHHGAALVAMVGTAVTVDAIDPQGRFLGGLILPGHGIMLRALESGTAGLRVPTGEVVDFPTNTSDALTSGGTYAITGAIEHMADRLRRYTGEEPHILVTGGAGWKVAPYLHLPYELIDSLIFDGLLTIAQYRARAA